MKLAKILVASFVLLAVTTAFSYKKFVQVDITESAGYLEWTGASVTPAIPFVIGTTSSSELDKRNNYADNITSSVSFSGSGKLAAIQFTTSGSYTDPDVPATVAELLAAIKANYISNSNSFTSFNVNLGNKGKTFFISVVQKS